MHVLPWAVPCLCNPGGLAPVLYKCHADIDKSSAEARSVQLTAAQWSGLSYKREGSFQFLSKSEKQSQLQLQVGLGGETIKIIIR